MRDRSIHRYKQLIRNQIDPHIGKIELKDLHLARIERFYGNLMIKGIGTRTIREVHALLHVELKKAVRYGYILNNPTQGASVPRYTHAEMKVLDESQVSSFLTTAQNRQDN